MAWKVFIVRCLKHLNESNSAKILSLASLLDQTSPHQGVHIHSIVQDVRALSLNRAGGTGRAGWVNARPIFWRSFVLFIYFPLPHPQNNEIHTAHEGG